MTVTIGLDLGTTGIRAIAFSKNGEIQAQSYEEVPLIFPYPGWVEQDPNLLKEIAFRVLSAVVFKVGATNVVGIGITNQRETTIVWNRNTGKPIHGAIVWQCRRTAELCETFSSHATQISEKTGLRLDPYFSAPKIKWICDQVPEAKSLAVAGELLFGTVDTWILWHLTGRQVHATDASNASRTMLMNIHTGDYDRELLNLFEIPASMLPEIRDSNAVFGDTSAADLGFTIPICSILGDQQASLFAHGQFNVGTCKNTYGTGLFIVANTGKSPVANSSLVTTVAWRINGQLTYAVEGSIFSGGSVIQWLRDGLGIIAHSEETDALATAVSDNGGVYFVPALTGLGAPHWDPHARGVLTGLTRGSDRRHIARAALESLAHQTCDVVDQFPQEIVTQLAALRVDGGATANRFLMKFQADLLQLPIVKTKLSETTALGAAMLAGVSTGFWTENELLLLNPIVETIYPSMGNDARKRLRIAWRNTVQKALS